MANDKNKITRFNMSDYMSMEEEPDGLYVSYSDHVKFVNKLRKAIKRYTTQFDKSADVEGLFEVCNEVWKGIVPKLKR